MKKTKKPLKNSLTYSDRVGEFIFNMMKYYGVYDMNRLPAHTRKCVIDMYDKVSRHEPIVTARQRSSPDFVWVTCISVVEDFSERRSWLITTSDGQVTECRNVDLRVRDAYKNGERVTLEALMGPQAGPIFAF
jgi:hypothetical protein